MNKYKNTETSANGANRDFCNPTESGASRCLAVFAMLVFAFSFIIIFKRALFFTYQYADLLYLSFIVMTLGYCGAWYTIYKNKLGYYNLATFIIGVYCLIVAMAAIGALTLVSISRYGV